eukprot:IDg16181t1
MASSPCKRASNYFYTRDGCHTYNGSQLHETSLLQEPCAKYRSAGYVSCINIQLHYWHKSMGRFWNVTGTPVLTLRCIFAASVSAAFHQIVSQRIISYRVRSTRAFTKVPSCPKDSRCRLPMDYSAS